MPRIIPLKDLKNTSGISDLCHATREPVFITRNGYGDMVIMSIETYEAEMLRSEVYKKVEEAEMQVAEGKTRNANSALNELKEKYDL